MCKAEESTDVAAPKQSSLQEKSRFPAPVLVTEAETGTRQLEPRIQPEARGLPKAPPICKSSVAA